MCRLFGRKSRSGRSETPLDAREQAALERELAESRDRAMPSAVDESFASGGPSYNNVNPVASIVNARGPGAVGLRRIFEPRKGWKPEDREEL
jgi:hypothetical protein